MPGIVLEYEWHGVAQRLPASTMPRHRGGECGEEVHFELPQDRPDTVHTTCEPCHATPRHRIKDEASRRQPPLRLDMRKEAQRQPPGHFHWMGGHRGDEKRPERVGVA